ncbi:MAG TPA: IPT/TIG domain-containing protein [Mycobacteriales bacterium]|nr:IPT/TIG domain-containing protein [Mycobacteriales bacterium]
MAANPGATTSSEAAATSTAASGPGSLLRADARHLLVDVRVAQVDDAVEQALEAAGARIVHEDSTENTITVAVAPTDLDNVGQVDGVQYVGDILTPQTSAVCDSMISEGDGILHASTERSHRGINGSGVTVGVLSDSFDKDASAVTHAADDVTADNLPGSTNTCGHTTPVTNLSDTVSGEDEGRGMAQTVHDLAPGANIAFATAFSGESAFASNIQSLASSAGAGVIVDDVTYFDEPFYQEGIISNAVDTVRAAGVDYFSSAANNNIIFNGHDVGSYEAVDGYRPTTCPVGLSLGAGYTDCHNFNDSGGTADPDFGFTVKANYPIKVDLQWAEPQSGVKTDIDMFLVNSSNSILASSTTQNPGSGGSQEAFENLSWTNGGTAQTVRLVIARYANSPNLNATPRFKFVFLENGYQPFSAMEYGVPTGTDVMGPTIFGHNGGPTTMSVAASSVTVSPSTVNSYSSHGPVTLLFNPVSGTTPATALGSPNVLAKPDITATDCVRNSFFGGSDGVNYRFCGTSDAAPHAAAVAALLKSQLPSASAVAVNTAMTSTAVSMGLPASTQGAGLIDADAAGGALSAPPTPTVTSVTPNLGPKSGGTTVVIKGTGFTGATAVTFGAAGPAGFTVNSATKITAVTPAAATTGVVNVIVTAPGGTSAVSTADHYTYKALPAVTGVSPSQGPVAGGTSVVITGSGFAAATTVKFGPAGSASFTINSATQITAIAPAYTKSDVNIRVFNPSGESPAVSADIYKYRNLAPSITSISPSSGPKSGGTVVTITGTGLTGANKVQFGSAGNATSFTVLSDTQMTATSPAYTTTGGTNIRVFNSVGESPAVTSDVYHYTTG